MTLVQVSDDHHDSNKHTKNYGSLLGVVEQEEGQALLSDRGDESTFARNRIMPKPQKRGAFALLLVCSVVLVLFVVQQQQQGTTHPEQTNGINNNKHNDAPLMGLVHRQPEDEELWFTQYVDHIDETIKERYSHRYYAKQKYFGGRGHPIILEVGGEGGLDDGFFMPFVDEHLAEKWGALVLLPEHRFYGKSQPVDPNLLTFPELAHLLELHQAMLDMLAVVKAYKDMHGCSHDKTSPHYCPVISVGGSYPGFVSALLRLHYPDEVDIAYASSAPLLLYADSADQFGYMDIVTRVADQASPGCAAAGKKTLLYVDHALRTSANFTELAYKKLNICHGTIPKRVVTGDVMADEIMMLVEQRMANANMAFYPPDDPYGDMIQICKQVFQNPELDAWAQMREFFKNHLQSDIDITLDCFDMGSQLPSGPNPAIMGADWSGVGYGYDGMMFDFHCCATLTPNVGFGPNSMFPYRKWTIEWLRGHCMDRFGIVPDMYRLVREYKFDDLVGQNASRILFVNGMNDLWSAGSYLESLSDTILAVNIADGAHHSDLNRYEGRHEHKTTTTKALRKAQDEIESILTGWLADIRRNAAN